MNGKPYTLDTNILIYSIDQTAGPRHKTAKDIITSASMGGCILTLQSISEFYAVATRKSMMPRAEAAGLAAAFIDLFQTATASPAAVRTALGAASSGRASYWDSLLLAAAAEAGCGTILTEDLADGTSLFGVRILNPFAGDSLTPDAAALLRPG